MYKRFADIAMNGSEGTSCLLVSVEERRTRKDATYCALTLRDGAQDIIANMWNWSKEQILKKVEEGTAVWVELDKKLFNEQESYVCKGIDTAPPDVVPEQFKICSPYSGEQMYDWLMKQAGKLDPDNPAVRLTKALYEENREQLLFWAAAKSIHHNIYGGLLYHTFRMVWSALELYPVYGNPTGGAHLNKELLICGTMLHDIGKLREMETDQMGSAEYTVEGNLLGHLLLGVEMIDREVWSHPDLFDENDERILALKHMVASHHGTLEWEAIKIPGLAEAMFLHFLDNLDAKMYVFEKSDENTETGTMDDGRRPMGARAWHASFHAVKET